MFACVCWDLRWFWGLVCFADKVLMAQGLGRKRLLHSAGICSAWVAHEVRFGAWQVLGPVADGGGHGGWRRAVGRAPGARVLQILVQASWFGHHRLDTTDDLISSPLGPVRHF